MAVSKIDNGLQDQINDLNSKFRIIWVKYTYSIGGNADAHFNLYSAANNVPGYTPVGILGFSTGSGQVKPITVRIANDSWGVFLTNTSTSAHNNIDFIADLLYQKN